MGRGGRGGSGGRARSKGGGGLEAGVAGRRVARRAPRQAAAAGGVPGALPDGDFFPRQHQGRRACDGQGGVEPAQRQRPRHLPSAPRALPRRRGGGGDNFSCRHLRRKRRSKFRGTLWTSVMMV